MRGFRPVGETIAGVGLSSGVLCFVVRTMAAGGTTSGRLSLQGFAFRTIAGAGSTSFALSVESHFGVTTAGPVSRAVFRFRGGGL
jgi:hypothetical protein